VTSIEFTAIVAKVQTLADGGIRVILDLPEQAIMQAAQLMECKRVGVVLDMAAKPRAENGTSDIAGRTKTKRRKADSDPRL
jgi:hypothetical protein